MNKKIVSILSFVFVFALVGVVSVWADSDNSKKAGDQHKSEVAKVVQDLIEIADRDSGIGTEVKAIAQEEATTNEKIKEKMNAVEDRGGFKTFLIGSDYKNLGALRSELVTTANHIEKLNKVLDKTISTSTKVELETQIENLSAIQTKAENFIKSEVEEGNFSLFGWLVKLFNK